MYETSTALPQFGCGWALMVILCAMLWSPAASSTGYVVKLFEGQICDQASSIWIGPVSPPEFCATQLRARNGCSHRFFNHATDSSQMCGCVRDATDCNKAEHHVVNEAFKIYEYFAPTTTSTNTTTTTPTVTTTSTTTTSTTTTTRPDIVLLYEGQFCGGAATKWLGPASQVHECAIQIRPRSDCAHDVFNHATGTSNMCGCIPDAMDCDQAVHRVVNKVFKIYKILEPTSTTLEPTTTTITTTTISMSTTTLSKTVTTFSTTTTSTTTTTIAQTLPIPDPSEASALVLVLLAVIGIVVVCFAASIGYLIKSWAWRRASRKKAVDSRKKTMDFREDGGDQVDDVSRIRVIGFDKSKLRDIHI